MRIRLMLPLYDAPGDGGGGGNAGLIGAGITSPSTSGGSGGSNVGTGGGTPITISDDSYITPPGAKEPVKYSDWKARHVDKSEFTKTTQAYAAQVKAAQAEIKRLQDAASRQPQGTPQQTPQTNQLQERLRELANAPYIDGKQAVQIVQDLYQNAVGPLAEAIKVRDQALALMFKKLQGVEQTAQGLSSRTTEGDFKTLLNSTRSSVGLPEGNSAVDEFLQDIYLSHEGSDLNREFPSMVKARFDALAQVVREMDRKRAQDARSRAAGIPTRGGTATPGKPLTQGHRSPQDRASAIWASLTGEEA